MSERFWLDETEPSELRRRAEDLEGDGLLAMARALRGRADDLDGPSIPFVSSRRPKGHPR